MSAALLALDTTAAAGVRAIVAPLTGKSRVPADKDNLRVQVLAERCAVRSGGRAMARSDTQGGRLRLAD